MPRMLEPGILYVAEEFGAAAHLCACGCGAKIRTPLGPTEWTLTETKQGPSLFPSVGNWQQACRSHYCIRRGRIVWAGEWSEEQVVAGRRREELRREGYFNERANKRGGIVQRLLRWLAEFFRK